MKFTTLGIKIGLALVVVVIFLMPTFVNATTWYVSPTGNDANDGSEPSPWRTIQHAVDQAFLGDTIKVMDDNIGDTDDYTENITVNQSLTIERHDSDDTAPWVKAADANDDVFHVTGDNVTISGLGIYGATGYEKYGIYVDEVSGCTIQDNCCGWDSEHKNYRGIFLDSSSNNTLSGNICLNNKYGINLSASSNNNLSDNTCSNNKYGINLNASSNNTLSGNTMAGNSYNFGVGGYYDDTHFRQNIDTSNTVDGKPIYYLVDARDEVIDASTNAGYVAAVSSSNVTVRDLNLRNNERGVLFVNTHDSQIENVTAQENTTGIYLYISSGNNTLSGNTCSNNDNGIYLRSSGNNTLLGNTMADNYGSNFRVNGSNETDFRQNIDISNTVDEKPIYYLVDAEYEVIDASTNAGYVAVVSSSNVTVRDLNLTNNQQGVLFAYTHDSQIENVTATRNGDGIYLTDSNNNTLLSNTCSNNYSGIYLYPASNSTLSGNTCSNNHSGIRLQSSSDNNTISGNTCSNNTYGIYPYYSNSNTIYLNNFNDNTTNVYSEHSTNIWHSPTKLGYLYGSSTQTYKSYMGNYYSDYTASDGDGNGIGDSPYDLSGDEPDDEYPLMQTTDNYALQTWWLANPIMYRGDISRPGGIVTISGGADQIWAADQATLMDVIFDAGDAAQETSWTGQVTFASVPANGDAFTTEIGYADDQNGTNFMSGGPETAIIGDNLTAVFTFTTNAALFIVPKGKYLALKITNNSSSDYSVNVGNSWSYVAAPIESQDYELPVELSAFTATASDSSVILHWRTESEINNLGFNVYRSDTKEGVYTRVNARRIPGAGTNAISRDYSFTDEQVVFGKTYYYYIEDIDFTGKINKSLIIEVTVGKQAKTMLLIPPRFDLLQNFPNPFNPETWIPYQLAKDAAVVINIYNTQGQFIRTLHLGTKKAAIYATKGNSAYWDGKNATGDSVSSGVYLYQLKADDFSATRKMVIIK